MRRSWTIRREKTLLGFARGLALGLALACVAAAPIPWRDYASGLAIGGYDPTAYFTLRAPRRGREAYELVWRGAAWRFVNPGNRAAFAEHPEVYAPRFAGYDATGIAAGRISAGHPSIWAIHRDRLYFFHDSVSRRLWSRDPDGGVARAEKAWPKLALDLPLVNED